MRTLVNGGNVEDIKALSKLPLSHFQTDFSPSRSFQREWVAHGWPRCALSYRARSQ